MAIAHVILDCDGVLVDSEPLSGGILTERLNAEGFAWTAEETERDLLGRSWASNVAAIEQRHGRPLPVGFKQRYRSQLWAAFERGLKPVPGVVAALERIELPACVASSGEHDRIRQVLGVTGLLARFEGRIFSAQDVEHGKPAPDLFLHAARAMGFDPARTAVVEDSPAGVSAGRAAGMVVLGYAGRTPAALLAAEGARVFADMADLPELLVA